MSEQPQTPPTFYERVGGHETFVKLVRAFYEGVAGDPPLRDLYPEEDLGPAEERLLLFLEQYWGGPKTYQATRGHPRLRIRHAPYAVTPTQRDRWLKHMLAAVDTLDLSPIDDMEMRDYLTRAAHFLINAEEEPVSTETLRGQYKVPGGKLVAVDVAVADGHLVHAALSGDFFLEPDEALDDINAALVGLPEDTGVDDIALAVAKRLRPGARLIGFTTDAIGIAVRRALGHATSWEDHTFDLIEPVTLDPRMHVALDEVLAADHARGLTPPSLRMWDWDSPLVVIGSFQSYRNEIDDEGRLRHGIDVVRRITGGGAMFMEPGNCVTYSLVAPTSLVEGLSFERSYEFLDQWVMGALAELGVNARYVPLNDIASDKGKIAGAAQRRLTGGVVLHHVTMAYDIDADKMLEVLRIGREKMSDKGTKSANKRVDPLRSQTQLPRDVIIDSFLAHFEANYNARRRTYTDDELARARELVETKFSTDAWTRRVP